MLIEGIDYYIYIVPFPQHVRTHGMVLLNPDGTASIYLDANATELQRRRAYHHEIDHLTRGDLYGDKDIRSVEKVFSENS